MTAADQASKAAAVYGLGHGRTLVLIPRLLQLLYRTNTGAAFSLFRDFPMVLAIFSTIVSVGLIVWGWRLRPADVGLRWPIGLILGGAVGNLIDRYRIGHVVDFIDAHWNNVYHFPTFNLADSAICVGMGWLISMSLRGGGDGVSKSGASPSSA